VSSSFLNEQLKNDIDDIINRALNVFQVPGAAVGIVAHGKLIYAKGFGYRDIEKKLPVNSETLFPIGSCSKAFTTFVLGTLVDEGLIKWDDPVIKHLPDFRVHNDYATQNLTIKDLATHRSGLPSHDFVWYNSNITPTEMYRRLRYLEFANSLRETFHYNNLMYVVLGLLINKVTGKSWEQNVQEKIFAPLGMKQSNFSVEESQRSDNFALPYSERNERVVQIPFRNISHMGPAGSINSTLANMSEWLQFQLSNGTFGKKQLIQENTLNEMHTLQFAKAEFPKERMYYLGLGLGWVIGIYGGHYLVAHGGGIDGFRADVSLMPVEQIGVIILTNNDIGGGFFLTSVSRSIFDRLLGLEQIDWIKKMIEMQKEEKSKKEAEQAKPHFETKLSHKLEDYVGEYENPGYDPIKISLVDGNLVAFFSQAKIPLVHKIYDTFSVSKDVRDPLFLQTHFCFQTNCGGDITELKFNFESQSIIFKKKVVNVGKNLKKSSDSNSVQ